MDLLHIMYQNQREILSLYTTVPNSMQVPAHFVIFGLDAELRGWLHTRGPPVTGLRQSG